MSLERALLAEVALERDLDCTCDGRFIAVANDIDCPVHGLASLADDRQHE